jgi:hypothetical protein
MSHELLRPGIHGAVPPGMLTLEATTDWMYGWCQGRQHEAQAVLAPAWW